ncbi:MAG: hypothetical protein RL346_498 [Verrucomicrobiota bacterium]|jgi:nicotinate-nucleotide adenylyltransferase
MVGQEVATDCLAGRGRKIGIFGGSFDPVHEGHIHLAALARETACLDEVWFLPCRISPHKLEAPPSASDLRLRCLELATRQFDWARIDRTEMETDGPSYSYVTMEKLALKFPDHQWFWIMGGDQWVKLTKWVRPQRLAEIASFIVMARHGEKIYPREGYRMQVVEGQHPASSTRIREALARKDADIPYLDPEVRRLIDSRR